MKHTCK